jgi:hypothetical protein
MKKGDKVYAATVWRGEVEVGVAEILGVTPRRVQIAAEGLRHGGLAFGCRAVIPHEDAHLDPAAALRALRLETEVRVGAAREALRSAEADLSAVADAFGEVQP